MSFDLLLVREDKTINSASGISGLYFSQRCSTDLRNFCFPPFVFPAACPYSYFAHRVEARLQENVEGFSLACITYAPAVNGRAGLVG